AVSGSLFTNNAAASGGAVAVTASDVPMSFTLVNSTLTTNTAGGTGGGVDVISFGSTSGTVGLINDTITGNTADTSGGVAVQANVSPSAPPAVVTLRNTIVAKNTAVTQSPDVFGDFTSTGGNLFGTTAGANF